MKANDNWAEAKDRLTALWRGGKLDRPCLCVKASSGAKMKLPPPPEDAEKFWLDPDWMRKKIRADITNTWWGAEAVPSHILMAGWMVSLGGKPVFDQRTIWFEETGDPDYSKPTPWRHRADDPWVAKYYKLYKAIADEAGYDDFLVGGSTFLPANDLLSMHMGTQQFLMALMDHPDWMKEAILTGGRDLLAANNEKRQLIEKQHAYWYGLAGWMPFWAPEPFIATQSDVSCMLSPEMFNEFILPELDLYGKEYGAMWYHLDGGDAKQHLPSLLSRPYMKVIQYVPAPFEPPNGIKHLDMYRRIQEAGKIVHIQVTEDQVEPLCRALDPSRLMLMTYCSSVEAGRKCIANSVEWSKRH